MTDKTKTVSIEVVFAGARKLTDCKVAYAILPLEDGALQKEREEKLYAKMKGHIIGGIYSVDMTEDRASIYPASMKFLRMMKSDALVASWKARSDADETSARAHREGEKLAGGLTAMKETLREIRYQWARTDRVGRRAIEAMILEAVRS